MKITRFQASPRRSRTLVARAAAASAAFATLCSCGENPKSVASIAMGQDVVMEGITGNEMSLGVLPHGGFVIAGYSWAIGTDANGSVIWRYADPDGGFTSTIDVGPQFQGVVPLSNGNIVLCGYERKGTESAAILTILDKTGQLVEKRLLQPPGPQHYDNASFLHCIRWNDGVAVLGYMIQGHTTFDWLMKLDNTGAKQWEVFDYRLIEFGAVETVEHNLVGLGKSDAAEPFQMTLVQVDSRGHTVSTKNLPFESPKIVRSGAPTTAMMVLTNINRNNTSVLTLDDKFAQIAPLWRTQVPVKGGAIAWVLWDGSLAIFDYVFAHEPGQVNADRACVSRIARDGRSYDWRVFALPDAQSRSERVLDAVPISERTFVALRSLNNSVALSWVTFK